MAKKLFSQQIRDAIEARGLDLSDLGRLTKVDPTILGRFLAHERDITTRTLDKIATGLDLRVVEVAKAAPRKKRKA